MPPAYVVRAQVIDVRTDTPRPDDRFVLDTNVWAYEHFRGAQYTASGGVVAQASVYAGYVQLTRDVGAVRHRVVTTLAELAHLVEQLEHAAYAAAVGPLDLKDYRHNLPSERARVVGEILKAWRKIEADSDLLPLALDDVLAAAALARLASAPVDGYDLFLLEAMAAAGVTQLITDDGDFCTVAGIEVFTANQRVIAAARTQGRLILR